ncbi:hypothetical protein [Glycomyces sp. NPDC048151]|uniref:hypothetical protein n=1 Tax=Glycomyces sp. NPDC048151 TaxID=3364002 RepID=UPI0037118BEF
MERTGPLNERQLATLQLIGSGDDLSTEQHVKLRITGRALASRGLVEVSRRDGGWRATITEAGRYYLRHGEHPGTGRDTGVPVRPPQQRRPRRSISGAASGYNERFTHVDERPAAPGERHRDALALIERLHKENPVRLLSLTEPEQDRWRKTIDYAKRHHLVPGGRFIEASTSARGSMTIRLVSSIHPNAARKLAASLPPVPVSERLHRPHPVIARLRDDDQRLQMPPDLRLRSLLLLQAITAAAVDQGWKVTEPAVEGHRHRNSYYQHSPPYREGEIQIGIDGFTYKVTIDQEFPQSADPVKSRTLKIDLPHYNAHGSRCEWADRKTMTLEERLPEIADALAKRAVADREGVITETNKKAERQRRWEAAVTQARVQAREHHLEKELKRQARAHEECRILREYCRQFEQRIAAADPDAPELESARAWLTWTRAFIETIDPFRTLPTMPEAPVFEQEALRPFLNGLNSNGPEPPSSL